jgi:hypothetical protein
MPNNRHLVNDFDILRPTQLLERGLPLPGLDGRHIVEHGWCCIITIDGVYQETLGPGKHHLGRYPFFGNVKATAVDTRIKTLTISTTREFTIEKPVPVEINLDLAVEYQVKDARRVVLEVGQPLTGLYDRVIQAVRGAVVFATVEDIRRQGETIAQMTLQRLQAMQLPKILGIEVFTILVNSIKATDAGNDALAARQMEEYTRVRDWQLDSQMLSQSQMTPEWMLMHRPEVYAQMMAGNQALMKELIERGMLDPAAVLSRPVGATYVDPQSMLAALTGGAASAFGGVPSLGSGIPATHGSPQLPEALPGSSQAAAGGDIMARMREDIRYLQALPGVVVETKPGIDDLGVPDGSYDVQVQLPRSSGGRLQLYVMCPRGYPQQPPTVELDLDDQPTPFQSAILRRWTGQYLVEIAREAKQYWG